MHKTTSPIPLFTAVLLLASCASSGPHHAAAPSPSRAASNTQLPAAGKYSIDPSQSELRILVYRAGALASLGHNHVMVNHAVSGHVEVGAAIDDSSFSLQVPVARFEVDDPRARREEGGDFPGEISEDARAGTLHNMLGPAMLNAAQFPTIIVRSLTLSEAQGLLTATLAVSVAGHESRIAAPFTLDTDGQSLSGAGAFELRQTAIGLTPYSLMGGALQVEDAMQLRFRITATR